MAPKWRNSAMEAAVDALVGPARDRGCRAEFPGENRGQTTKPQYGREALRRRIPLDWLWVGDHRGSWRRGHDRRAQRASLHQAGMAPFRVPYAAPAPSPLASHALCRRRDTRFVADAHLGGLARLLRMAGFDTAYNNAVNDAEIERIAECDGRIVLDRDLLTRRAISHGCYVYAQKPDLQLSEILARLDLARCLRPLSRCLKCNTLLVPVDKALVSDALPPRVRECRQAVSTCEICRRVLWEGSHWRHMLQRLAKAVAAAGYEQPSTPCEDPIRRSPSAGKASLHVGAPLLSESLRFH